MFIPPPPSRIVKFLTFAVLVFLLRFPAIAQEQEQEPDFSEQEPFAYRMSIGLGPEWNMNTHEYFAGGLALNFDYNFARFFAAGIGFITSSNFADIVVLEPTAMFRWYFMDGYSGFFVQTELGAHLLFDSEKWKPLFLGGLRSGFRFSLGRFYVEPYGRMGYPFLFGIGTLAGIRFIEEPQKPDAVREQEQRPREYKLAIGFGPEYNMNTREYFAGGFLFNFDYNLPHSFAVGVNFCVSNNFTGTTVMEPAAMFRWYVLQTDHAGLFAQVDLGASMILAPHLEDLVPLFLGGVRAGYRIPLGKFYVEPFGRGGYPFAFGVGVLAGIRFMEEKQWEADDTYHFLRR